MCRLSVSSWESNLIEYMEVISMEEHKAILLAAKESFWSNIDYFIARERTSYTTPGGIFFWGESGLEEDKKRGAVHALDSLAERIKNSVSKY